jgi:two-component system alkaline phosphatase synthesis response regulator PhoP
MPQRILVVDDDREIVRLVRAYLEQSGFEVLVAYDGNTALHAIRRDRPDLVVLDLMLPDRDGREITRIVRSTPALAKLPIVMLTARIEDTDKIVGLELGADDYVTKPFSPQVVVARVRAVLRRTSVGIDERRVLRVRELSLDLDRHQAAVGGRPLDLTSTEFAFLRALMQAPDHAFTRSELIERALGYEYEGLERTVDSHIKNLRQKIEPDPKQPTYIETVYGVGYRLVGGLG